MSKPAVAIVGASANRDKFGNKSVRAHVHCGYEVFPVNPKGGEIEGLTAYCSILDIPMAKIARFSLYVPPAIGEALLDEIRQKACQELWLNPGSGSPELLKKAHQLGLNVIEGCSIVDLGVSPADFP